MSEFSFSWQLLAFSLLSNFHRSSISGETSQRLVTQRIDSFVDFCGRARTLESSTNDSNLFDESLEESFDESFALWAFKIT
jgi:hypothetical protein